VVEAEDSWDYLEDSDKRLNPSSFNRTKTQGPTSGSWNGTPIRLSQSDAYGNGAKGAAKGMGRTLETTQNARELRDVELQL